MPTQYATQLDHTGQTFGRWKVLRRAPNSKDWECVCSCGRTKVVCGAHLRSGASRSCGCGPRRGNFRHGHGCKGKESKTYQTWHSMLNRCRNEHCEKWKDYGGRGITVCERWLQFVNFLADMGERPAGMMIERIDNNGNYEPSNCRWATRKEQGRNKRNNFLVAYEGRTQCLSAWSEELNMPTGLIQQRLARLNWPIDRALQTPSQVVQGRGRRGKGQGVSA